MGHGTQRRAECVVLVPDNARLHVVCAAAGDDTLPFGVCALRAGIDGETHAGDFAIRSAVARFLATSPLATRLRKISILTSSQDCVGVVFGKNTAPCSGSRIECGDVHSS